MERSKFNQLKPETKSTPKTEIKLNKKKTELIKTIVNYEKKMNSYQNLRKLALPRLDFQNKTDLLKIALTQFINQNLVNLSDPYQPFVTLSAVSPVELLHPEGAAFKILNPYSKLLKVKIFFFL